jgi:hypothetical protein
MTILSNIKDKVQSGFERVIDTEAKIVVLKLVAVLSLAVLVVGSLETLTRKIRLESWIRGWLTEARVLAGYNYVMSSVDFLAALIVAVGLAYLAVYCYKNIYSDTNPPKEKPQKNKSGE